VHPPIGGCTDAQTHLGGPAVPSGRRGRLLRNHETHQIHEKIKYRRTAGIQRPVSCVLWFPLRRAIFSRAANPVGCGSAAGNRGTENTRRGRRRISKWLYRQVAAPCAYERALEDPDSGRGLRADSFRASNADGATSCAEESRLSSETCRRTVRAKSWAAAGVAFWANVI